jgi:hypothetical protein
MMRQQMGSDRSVQLGIAEGQDLQQRREVPVLDADYPATGSVTEMQQLAR